ncbi:MAG: GNAT family N-acetyltransferase [Chloroflexota bacterium]|nr:MAG: GNAT family N-acetyltransferase [Chloroflexota bacterium]
MSEQVTTKNTTTHSLSDQFDRAVELNGKSNKEEKNMILEETFAPEVNIEEQFLFRPATMADLEPAVKLFEICSKHMIGRPEATLSDVRAEWLLPDFDLETSTRVVLTPEGRLVGYAEVWDIDETPVNIWVWGRVHPDYEGQGIGSTLMDWARSRARQALNRVPDDVRVVMRSGTYSTYKPGHQLLKDHGMTPIRHFFTMAIELAERPPGPTWPAGITVRPMKGPEEARDVVWAVDNAFRDHWGYVEQPFEKELEHWLHFMKHEEHFDPDLWYLAMDGDEIAGVSLCMPQSREDKDMGWVRVLGVRRPWRRKGLGLALLHYSFGEFYKSGKARVGLGVDASSLTGATRLYERAGMHPIRQWDTYELELRPGRDITLQELNE